MLKKVLFVALVCYTWSFAALTLQQRVNLTKGVALTDPVTWEEKAKKGLRKAAQEVLDGTITPAHTAFAGHPVRQEQLTEWALRVLQGSLDGLMLDMIMDQGSLPADPNSATDVQIMNAVRNSMWPYVQLIGSGSF